MKRPVRCGIAGYGGFAARAIAPAIKSVRHAQLVALQHRSAETHHDGDDDDDDGVDDDDDGPGRGDVVPRR